MVEAAEKKKKRTFRKYTYRGVDLDQLLDMTRYWVFQRFARPKLYKSCVRAGYRICYITGTISLFQLHADY